MNIPQLQPLPHKNIFKKHNLSLGRVALAVGRSYPFLCNVLNGSHKPSAETLRRLDELVEHLEEEGGE